MGELAEDLPSSTKNDSLVNAWVALHGLLTTKEKVEEADDVNLSMNDPDSYFNVTMPNKKMMVQSYYQKKGKRRQQSRPASVQRSSYHPRVDLSNLNESNLPLRGMEALNLSRAKSRRMSGRPVALDNFMTPNMTSTPFAELFHTKRSGLSEMLFQSQRDFNPIDEQQYFIHSLPMNEILDLYAAKCRDNRIEVLELQSQRFREKLRQSCKKRLFVLREMQLGIESSKVLHEIFKKNMHFTSLDLAKNQIGDQGAKLLADALNTNDTLISLNIASNNLSSIGADHLFSVLLKNCSIVSVNISSFEGLNRNRVVTKGVMSLEHVLALNPVLQIIDLSSTGLTKEGCEYICKGLENGNQSLSSLNLADNDIGPDVIVPLAIALHKTNIVELNLRNTHLGDTGLSNLVPLFRPYSAPPALERLDLSMNGATCASLMRICDAIPRNHTLKRLKLSNNKFSGRGISCIIPVLWENTTLTHLELDSCELTATSGETLGTALARNVSLEFLGLAHNLIRDEGVRHLALSLKHHPMLKELDLSDNGIKAEGGFAIAELIKINSSLNIINLHNNSLGTEVGSAINDAMRVNKTVKKMNLQLNAISHKFLTEIEKALMANDMDYRRKMLPNSRAERHNLLMFKSQKVNLEEEMTYNEFLEKQMKKEVDVGEDRFQRDREVETQKVQELEGGLAVLVEKVRQLDREKAELDGDFADEIRYYDETFKKLDNAKASMKHEIGKFDHQTKSVEDSIFGHKAIYEQRLNELKQVEADDKRKATLTEASYNSFVGKVRDLKVKMEKARVDDQLAQVAFEEKMSQLGILTAAQNRPKRGKTVSVNARKMRASVLDNDPSGMNIAKGAEGVDAKIAAPALEPIPERVKLRKGTAGPGD